ncbi:MAG: tetratricopeptide repeat protein [Actinomycetota bacterium]|nr:tetratricopeptide repeat protein [Actinomycetota bacterium]
MTLDDYSDYTKELKISPSTGAGSGGTRSENGISLWLAGLIVCSLILIFVIAGLIVRTVYFQPPKIRTAVERELYKYRDAINKNPNDSDAYIGLAGVYLEINQPQKAIDMLNKAIKISPNSWSAEFEFGLAYDALGKTDDAISHFWQAANINPGSELAFYQLGKLYMRKKLYGQAIQAFKKTIRINPTLADAHYYLGYCYEKTNKIELAKNEYREALKYITDYPEAKKALKRLE